MDVCAWVGLECSTTKQEAQVSLKKGGHLGYFLPLQLLCCKTLASFQGNNILYSTTSLFSFAEFASCLRNL